MGQREDGRPFGLADVVAALGVSIEPLSNDLVSELLAVGRLPAAAIEKAYRYNGAFCAERYSVFFERR